MRILFVFPGDLDTPTGGYRYDRAILQQLETQGHEVTRHSLSGNYPFPTSKEKQAAIESLDELAPHDVAVVDGLAGGVLPEFMQALAAIMPVAALIHHPLCLENGLEEEKSAALEASECDGLNHVSQIITTSPATSRIVASLFGVEPGRVACVLPGLEFREIASPEENNGTVRLLCVGSIIERKGHTFLVEALGMLAERDWQLDCVGETKFQPKLYAELEQAIVDKGLAGKIRFHGAVSQENLAGLYRAAHAFVLPSLYEGYGMAYAEAICSGLPVIGTTGGAIPDTVPQGCGILVEPGNAQELSTALEVMIEDSEARNLMRSACLAARDDFPDWAGSAGRFAKILEEIV